MFDPATLEVLSLSLWVATTAVLLSLPLALVVAWFLARSRWRGKMLVDALVQPGDGACVLAQAELHRLIVSQFSDRGA